MVVNGWRLYVHRLFEQQFRQRTLRKSGSRTDPYRVVRAMLEAGDPPNTMEQLLVRAKEVKDG
jgi:hypothetical protein